MDDPLKGYRHQTPTARLRWRGDVLEQKWLITDKDGVSNPAYEWRAVEHMAQRSATRRPTHPGAILREDVLPALGLSPERAAEAMGVDPEIVRWVLSETASVTPELAEAIGRLVGNGPNLWLRMQEAHDAPEMLVATDDIRPTISVGHRVYAMNDSPDAFSVHEAMHMASVFGDLVAQRLMEHRAIVARPDWFKLAEEAQEKLFELYQAIGREHLAGDDQQ